MLLCLEILPHCKGRKFIANCGSEVAFESLSGGPHITLRDILKAQIARLRSKAKVRAMSKRYGITAKFFDSSSVIDNEIGPAIFHDFLPQALASGRYRPAPPPKIAGHGLSAVQHALNIQRAGVSASKIVVLLE